MEGEGEGGGCKCVCLHFCFHSKGLKGEGIELTGEMH